MAGFTKAVCILVLATVLLVAVAPGRGEAAIGCDTVLSDLTPCLPYVTNQGALGSCCSGVQALFNAATTPPDRQSACNCLKALLKAYPAVNLDKAAALPGLCGINLPYKISPSTDCSTV